MLYLWTCGKSKKKKKKKIFEYGTNFDKKLNDPVWETVSRKIKKYKPFLNIDVPKYKKILKQTVL